uniref:Uncharacterized protein n=1 Tax=Bicosoecida sp. CB-2014 TaxID=1486930 RepID=A0A7S1C7B4_9STRA
MSLRSAPVVLSRGDSVDVAWATLLLLLFLLAVLLLLSALLLVSVLLLLLLSPVLLLLLAAILLLLLLLLRARCSLFLQLLGHLLGHLRDRVPGEQEAQEHMPVSWASEQQHAATYLLAASTALGFVVVVAPVDVLRLLPFLNALPASPRCPPRPSRRAYVRRVQCCETPRDTQ